MSLQELTQNWTTSFKEAISSIEEYITPQSSDYKDLSEFRTLSKWLLETPISGYDFMPHGYTGYRYEPYSTTGLLSLIHHALIDDGEVSFVKMNYKNETLRVFMIFTWHNEDNFRDLCLKENNSLINMITDYSEKTQKILTIMKEKYPDNEKLNTQPISELEDFTFVTHRNPVQFIEEVENFENLRVAKTQKNEERRKKLLK